MRYSVYVKERLSVLSLVLMSQRGGVLCAVPVLLANGLLEGAEQLLGAVSCLRKKMDDLSAGDTAERWASHLRHRD